MSNRTVIKIEGLSKQYRLGEVGTGTLSHDLNRLWCKIRGKEDPYATVGEVNDRTVKGESDYVQVLSNIDLDVEQGEILGIIGKNGAGKSTLLKILSKVTGPTEGIIKTKGRIASLLEVGTGFHPELTGRDNIYMNGTLMGMTRKEIASKLDEIVTFAGIERYVDTPVKRYSSGMTVRLGFAIAAHLEPEILVVDEVLAVGDADFQKKALGKMKDVSSEEGRTILFVSHNMAAVSSLCTRTIYLENGQVKFDGDTSEAIHMYYGNSSLGKGIYVPDSIPKNYLATVTRASVVSNGEAVDDVAIDQCVEINIEYDVRQSGLKVYPNIHIKDEMGNYVFVTSDAELDPGSVLKAEPGKYVSTCRIPANLLNSRTYYIGVALTQVSPLKVFFFEENALFLHVSDSMASIPTRPEGYVGAIPGIMRPLLQWQLKKEEH